MDDMVQFIGKELISEYLGKSRKHPRGRVMYNLHRSFGDAVQRMVNFIQPGSYVMPHRHKDPHKFETFIVIRGEIALFLFDDEGRVTSCFRLGCNCDSSVGDVLPPAWHCYMATEEDTVVFETKQGPYNEEVDKRFASWAPLEGSPDVEEYIASLWTNVK